MDDYIYFQLNDRKLKINRNDSNDIWIYFEYYGKNLSKNPRWRQVGIWVDTKNYYRCCIGKKKYKHHRIVYYAHNQDWDLDFEPIENPIDHIDENKQNNDIINLRVGTMSLNQQNQKNVKGYSWDKSNQTYRAYIAVNGIHYSLGSYKKEEDAAEARKKGKEKYHEW
tara:strand:+ start:33 stop:533 length:501 start_codon:yes stop_codon:yes gene_type:complete